MTSSSADAELEREIRRERTFTMAEAIGRLAGSGSMKGASPISRLQQAQVKVDEHLKQRLDDRLGILVTVLSRQVREGRLLLESVDHPLAAIRAHVQAVLGSTYLLEELVRETDMEWGQVFGERPYFEREGRAADPDDPYTVASVRATLSQFLTAGP